MILGIIMFMLVFLYASKHTSLLASLLIALIMATLTFTASFLMFNYFAKKETVLLSVSEQTITYQVQPENENWVFGFGKLSKFKKETAYYETSKVVELEFKVQL